MRPQHTNASRFAEQKTYTYAIDVYLRDCYARRLVVRTDTLADRLRTTREHLARRVAQVFGRPLGSILREKQIDEAKRLLIAVPSLSMDDVAAAAGFGTRTTLFRRFKADVGCTPNEYRQAAGAVVGPVLQPSSSNMMGAICDATALRLPRPTSQDHKLQLECDSSSD